MTTPNETTTMLRLGGRTAYASGVGAAIGVVFLIAMFASFAVGARPAGMVFGWINDLLGVVGALLMVPVAVALHVLLRSHAPVGTVATYRDSANSRGVRYYYVIEAVNATGQSPRSNEATAIAK